VASGILAGSQQLQPQLLLLLLLQHNGSTVAAASIIFLFPNVCTPSAWNAECSGDCCFAFPATTNQSILG